MSITKTSQLMACQEINAVDYGSPAKHMTALHETQTAPCFILITYGTSHNQAQSSCLGCELNIDCMTGSLAKSLPESPSLISLVPFRFVCFPLLSLLCRCYENMGLCIRCIVTCPQGQMCWMPPFSSLVSKGPALSFCRDNRGSGWSETLLTTCVITQYHNPQG